MVTEMDTLVLPQKHLPKLIANTINVSIIAGLLFSQHIFEGPPILANELTIAHNTIVSPIFSGASLEKNIVKELTVAEKTEKFNSEIRQKYKAGVIVDVDRGVKHIKMTKYYQGRPVKINVVEVNSGLNQNLQLTPAIASDTLNHRSTIANIAKKNNSIVAINGTYFKPETGVPLGTLMIDKKMYTGPIYNRVSMGIFDNKYDMARIQLNATVKSKNDILTIDNINQPRMLSTYTIVYTPQWGKTAPPSPKYGTQIAVDKDNKIIAVATKALEIPEDGYVIVGPAIKLAPFVESKKMELEVQTTPEWNDVKHIISGGPYLVKNSEIFVDMTEQKLGSIGGRNPRTAIGYTADNNLILVTVDGREEASVGMTLMELANFMKSIGCVSAMNLDGGGSTVMYINGKVVNCPTFKGGIALSNALTLNKIE